MPRKHSHYFKPVPAGVTHIDVYRVLQMFGVTDQALGHAIKKLLVAGGRGVKDQRKDIQEAVDTLQRKLEMMDEDAGVSQETAVPYLGADRRSTSRQGPDSDGWIQWTGRGSQPVDDGVVLHLKLRNGSVMSSCRARDVVWTHGDEEDDIVAYKGVL